jgi:hypothetical protein
VKALTVRQPHAQLIALGVKTIETRSWQTAFRGPLLIHAGLHTPDHFYGEDGPCGEIYGGPDHDPELLWQWFPEPPENGGGWTLGDIQGNDSHDMPLGAIVASCKLVDCVPILEGTVELALEEPRPCVVPHGGTELSLWRSGSPEGEDIADQLPYGDFTPGRFAWLLEDIKPVEQRCPACWGSGNGPNLSWSSQMADLYEVCPVCTGSKGCDPISAKGKQGLWNWEP